MYHAFDEEMTKPLLDSIIKRIESEGFRIQGITFDLGNKKLTSQLKFQTNHFFINPYDKSRNVFMFPDVPHLIKLARNHVFDTGFKVPSEDGNLVPLVKQDFEDVLAKNRGSELRTAFNLSRAHLDVKGSQRQRVRLAVQVLSSTVAQEMLQLGPDTNEYKAKHKAVKLFNDWFDVMNAKSRNDKNPLSRGMSPDANATNQLKILDKMEAFLLRFHVMDTPEREYRPKAKQPWQYGIMCSIKSTKALYQQLVVETGSPFKFLLTAKLNQDCLENLFSRLRALGGDNVHPTPIEALRRMRILLLNNGAELLIRQPAVEMESIQMEDEDGNPVSDEDIAEQKMILEKEKEEYTAEQIADHQARQEFIDRETSPQLASHEEFPSVIEQYDVETNAVNIFEIDLALMEAEEREEKQRLDIKKDEEFTKVPRNVFDKTFNHSSSTSLTVNELNENMNTDTIHFETAVIITAITLVPNKKKLHVAYPKKRTIFGRTTPNRFAFELYCNDLSETENDKASYLDSMGYDDESGICTISFPQNNKVSNMLVLRGKYTNMTVMVVGRIEKKYDTEAQGLGYVSGYLASKGIKDNKKKEESLKKAEEKGTNRKRKHEEIEEKPFVPQGQKTNEFTRTEANDSLTPWIFSISRGSLVVPDREFFLDAEKFEEEFNAYHEPFLPPINAYCLYDANEKIENSSNGKCHFPFKKGTKIIDGLTEILVRKFGHKYERKILADFSKTRLNIRIKAAKIKLAEDNAERLQKNQKRRKMQKTTRDWKQLGQLTNSGTRDFKQQGQFTN